LNELLFEQMKLLIKWVKNESIRNYSQKVLNRSFIHSYRVEGSFIHTSDPLGTFSMGKTQSKLSTEKVRDLSLKTRFNQKDISNWFKGFNKDFPKGYIEKQEFHLIYKQYFPFGDPLKYASFVFDFLDIDNDGKLSFEEFIVSLDVSAKGTTEEKLECTL
jgi:hypothetical protein